MTLKKSVDIPPHFRCPISFELMEDPVTLCTGITYERASIQKWLEQGNDACPVTMQVLESKELIPNCTLLHLITSWCTLNRPPSAAAQLVRLSLPKAGAEIDRLVDSSLQSKSSLDYELLKALGRCCVDHSIWRKVCESERLVAAVAAPFSGRTGAFRGEEESLFILVTMCQHDASVARRVGKCFQQDCGVLASLLRKENSLRTRVNAAKLVDKLLADDDELLKARISSSPGLIQGLIDLLKPAAAGFGSRTCSSQRRLQQQQQEEGEEESQGEEEVEESLKKSAVEPVLRSLAMLCSSKASSKLEAIRFGVVSLLVDILASAKEKERQAMEKKAAASTVAARKKNKRVRQQPQKQQQQQQQLQLQQPVIESSLALLKAMCSCAEGRQAVAAVHEKVMQAILIDMVKCSARGVEHGVIVIWSCLCHCQRSEEAFVEGDGMAKMAMVLQSDCTPLAKQRAADVLKHFSWLWKV